jgi:Glycosyl transferase family 2
MLLPFPRPPVLLPREPLVSIIITNHNYARFLPTALSSALDQRGAEVEVIVVDDGSTDASREILARRRDEVRIVLQERQGQKAAFNAGFAIAKGDIIMFLDADDVLAPGTAAAVATALVERQGAGRAVFRLEVIDEGGQPTGAVIPSGHMPLPDGDVREAALHHPDDLAWPPTSGNAFAAWALRRIMPIAVDDQLTDADMVLHALTPLLAPVVAVDRVSGGYRFHGANAAFRGGVDAERSRSILRAAERTHAVARQLAVELGYPPPRPRSVMLGVHRLLSLRLGGAGHPVPGDSRWRAIAAGVGAARGHADVAPIRRAQYAAWFVAAGLAPRRSLPLLSRVALQQTRSASPRGRLAGR